MSGVRERRLLAGAAAIVVWLVAAAALVTFGGTAGAAGTAASEQYKPPPPPATVLSGLAQPADVAADSKGRLWFTQGAAPASTTVRLYSLAKGSTSPVLEHSASGGDGSITPFITDIAFDAGDNPYFVRATGAGAGIDTALTRLDAATGATTTLASESGTHDVNGRLTSGAAILQTEVGVDGSVYWTTETVTGSGSHELTVEALAPGAATPALVAAFATPGVNHSSTGLELASDGTVYLQVIVGELPGPGSTGVYRIAPGGSPQPVRVFPNAPDSPRPFYVGLDADDNLTIGERIVNGPVSPQCASSATFRLVRYSAAELATPAPAGTVFSSATYPEFNFLFVGSSTYFRVSDAGDVLFGLYSGNSRCTSGVVTFTHLRMIGVRGDDPNGTQHVLFDDAPSPPAVGFYSLAFSGGEAYGTASRLGTLSRIDLNKNAKKPK